MKFDWDLQKAAYNRMKHGIDFSYAMTAFDDPFALIAEDSMHSSDEIREWLIGAVDIDILVIVFTKRDRGNVIRIISARKANAKERWLYEKSKGIPL